MITYPTDKISEEAVVRKCSVKKVVFEISMSYQKGKNRSSHYISDWLISYVVSFDI